jgi:Arc/MetJ family transcription regulator
VARRHLRSHRAPSRRYARADPGLIATGIALGNVEARGFCGRPRRYVRATHSDAHRVYTRVVRTNIVIDDELLAEAQRLCGASTKRATVEFALQELVRRRERRKVLDLQGRVEWTGDLGKSRRSV